MIFSLVTGERHDIKRVNYPDFLAAKKIVQKILLKMFSVQIPAFNRHFFMRKLMPKVGIFYIAVHTKLILKASMRMCLLIVRLLQFVCLLNVMGPSEQEIWGSQGETFWWCFAIKEICYSLQSSILWETRYQDSELPILFGNMKKCTGNFVTISSVQIPSRHVKDIA